MQGGCCDGEHYNVQDDMGYIYCSYWRESFDENYDNNLCEICEDMGGPCEEEAEE